MKRSPKKSCGRKKSRISEKTRGQKSRSRPPQKKFGGIRPSSLSLSDWTGTRRRRTRRSSWSRVRNRRRRAHLEQQQPPPGQRGGSPAPPPQPVKRRRKRHAHSLPPPHRNRGRATPRARSCSQLPSSGATPRRPPGGEPSRENSSGKWLSEWWQTNSGAGSSSSGTTTPTAPAPAVGTATQAPATRGPGVKKT